MYSDYLKPYTKGMQTTKIVSKNTLDSFVFSLWWFFTQIMQMVVITFTVNIFVDRVATREDFLLSMYTQADKLAEGKEHLFQYLTKVTADIASEDYTTASTSYSGIFKMCPTLIHSLRGPVYFPKKIKHNSEQ